MPNNQDDYAGNTQTTAGLAVGGSITGRVNAAGDTDWFAIDLIAGHKYTCYRQLKSRSSN